MPEPESFPELDAFVEEQRRRHRRLIAAVLAGSVLLIAGGVASLWLAGEGRIAFVAGGLLMLGLGVLGVLRGLYSLLTDVDTRDRGEWDAVVGNEDRGEDEPR